MQPVCEEMPPPQRLCGAAIRSAARSLGGVAVLIGLIAEVRPAIAAVCRVPAAVLCEGCVEHLSIRITGGRCRVSFTAAASSPASAGDGKFVDIDVEAEPLRPAYRRHAPGHRGPAARGSEKSTDKPAAAPQPPAGCFNFNGRQFCE